MAYQLIYGDYKDAATGIALTVVAGSSYTCVLAPGRILGTPAFPNDGRWTNATTFTGWAIPASGEETSAPVKITPAFSVKDKEGA
jgi:hypothetical protein